MFLILTWGIVIFVGLALVYTYLGCKDVFHPLMFIGPMLIFMYAWMPLKLEAIGGLAGFFQRDQLEFVQLVNFLGVVCFVCGALSLGARLPYRRKRESDASPLVLKTCGIFLGCLGVAAWCVTVVHGTGGDLTGYRGGWDDSGYIRDASLLMFPAFLLILAGALKEGIRILHVCLMAFFIAPLVIEAAFSARRGPTFMIAVVLTIGSFMYRKKRPSLLLTGCAGALLGMLMLFLVSNRQNIYLGSDQQLTTDVTSIVEKPDTGNEFIYGTGTMLSAEQRDTFFWGRRYVAQLLIRPIPSSVWPTKYEDFGVPELMHNAGTGEGLLETLGWEGAEGSAPGLIADLWAEFYWLNLLALFFLGRLLSHAWRKSQIEGGVWIAQYVIMAALSVYLVMQTMEAVIFRLLILSIPLRVAWFLAERSKSAAASSRVPPRHPVSVAAGRTQSLPRLYPAYAQRALPSAPGPHI